MKVFTSKNRDVYYSYLSTRESYTEFCKPNGLHTFDLSKLIRLLVCVLLSGLTCMTHASLFFIVTLQDEDCDFIRALKMGKNAFVNLTTVKICTM